MFWFVSWCDKGTTEAEHKKMFTNSWHFPRRCRSACENTFFREYMYTAVSKVRRFLIIHHFMLSSDQQKNESKNWLCWFTFRFTVALILDLYMTWHVHVLCTMLLQFRYNSSDSSSSKEIFVFFFLSFPFPPVLVLRIFCRLTLPHKAVQYI